MTQQAEDRATQLQALLYETIALARAMQLQVSHLDNNRIAMEAPVADANFNIHGTAFAGSIYSLCALSAWGLVQMRLLAEELDAEVVIAEADIKYLLPVNEAICTVAELDESTFQAFRQGLVTKGRARIEIEVEVRENEKRQAAFKASVAVKLNG